MDAKNQNNLKNKKNQEIVFVNVLWRKKYWWWIYECSVPYTIKYSAISHMNHDSKPEY